MKPKEIEAYIDDRGSVAKEVFSSIVNSKSKTSKDMAKRIAVELAKQINTNVVGVNRYLQEVSVENFIVFAEEWEAKKNEHPWTRWVKKNFSPQLLWVVSYIFDLDYKALMRLKEDDHEAYLQTGDGMVLAGLYLHLSEQHNQP